MVPEGATLDRIDGFPILAFDPETTANELVEQFREIAQTDETERKTRTRGGGIKVGEDGVITQIAGKAKYYFGPLEGVDGGDGAQVPDGATFDSIGKILDTLKRTLKKGRPYRTKHLSWWQTKTQSLLHESILNLNAR